MATAAPNIDTHNATVTFGKYEGALLTRVPVSYLRWAVSMRVQKPVCLHDLSEVTMQDACKAELQRRGERIETMDVSPHTIDRVSQKFLRSWKKHRMKNEGLFTWCQRMGELALEYAMHDGKNFKIENGVISCKWCALIWVLRVNLAVPCILTVKGTK